ncbi:MAG: SDR family oxidoreductase [Acidobacteriota bacterium]|nr:SDR family oxidoreductase [Acidobacteriota bacterium]
MHTAAQLNVRTAVVTGGSRGIGLAIAEAFAAAGVNVAITGRDEEALAAAEQTLSRFEGRVLASRTDVRDYGAVETLMRTTAAAFGGIDVLVNNAGVGIFGPIDEMSVEDWHTVIDTNVNGVFYCAKAALPYLRKSPNAYVINISSLAGRNWFAGGAAYCASKAAVNAFSESMMQDVRNQDIRVSYIMPGSVATEFGGPAAGKPSDWKLQADDIARVVLDLVGSDRRALASRVEMRPSKPR